MHDLSNYAQNILTGNCALTKSNYINTLLVGFHSKDATDITTVFERNHIKFSHFGLQKPGKSPAKSQTTVARFTYKEHGCTFAQNQSDKWS